MQTNKQIEKLYRLVNRIIPIFNSSIDKVSMFDKIYIMDKFETLQIEINYFLEIYEKTWNLLLEDESPQRDFIIKNLNLLDQIYQIIKKEKSKSKIIESQLVNLTQWDIIHPASVNSLPIDKIIQPDYLIDKEKARLKKYYIVKK